MDETRLTDTLLRVFGRNYRHVNNRWWVLLDGNWRFHGARERIHGAVARTWGELWPQEYPVPEYRVMKQVRVLIPYLLAFDLPGRPEHTPLVAKHLGLEQD